MGRGKQLKMLFNANLKNMFREKQVWFWNIFFPVILMSIFMLIFGGSSSENFKATIAVVEKNPNTVSGMLAAQLREVNVLEWKTGVPVSPEQADDWLKRKEVDAVIILPDTADAADIGLLFNKENEQNATSQGIAGIVNQFIQHASWYAVGLQPPYGLNIDSVSSGTADLKYEDFLLTGMIGLAVAQGGLFGMVEMVEIRRKGLLKRLRMTPVRIGLYGLGGMLVRVILGVVQMVLLSAIGVFAFGAKLNIDAPTLIIAFLAGTLAFNAMGYLFSAFSKSIEAYMGLANIASFLMMFLSGIFFPTNMFPDWLKVVSEFIPLTYFVEGMRDGMAYGSGWLTKEFWIGIGVLAAWGAATYVIGAIGYRRMKVEAR